jgi:hypothetical protein
LVGGVELGCRTMRKPILMSKLRRQLDKMFYRALSGEPAPFGSVFHSPAHQSQEAARNSTALLSADVAATTTAAAPSAGSLELPASVEPLLRGCSSSRHAERTMPQSMPTYESDAAVSASASAAVASAASSSSVADSVAPIPATQSLADPRSLNASSQSLASQYPLRILVVEDNQVNMRLVVRMLSALGYTGDAVAQSWNGAEAVERVVTQGLHADIILMDNIMSDDDNNNTQTHRRRSKALALSRCCERNALMFVLFACPCSSSFVRDVACCAGRK